MSSPSKRNAASPVKRSSVSPAKKSAGSSKSASPAKRNAPAKYSVTASGLEDPFSAVADPFLARPRVVDDRGITSSPPTRPPSTTVSDRNASSPVGRRASSAGHTRTGRLTLEQLEEPALPGVGSNGVVTSLHQLHPLVRNAATSATPRTPPVKKLQPPPKHPSSAPPKVSSYRNVVPSADGSPRPLPLAEQGNLPSTSLFVPVQSPLTPTAHGSISAMSMRSSAVTTPLVPHTTIDALRKTVSSLSEQVKDMRRYFRAMVQSEQRRLAFAATRIQAAWRGYRVRKTVQITRMDRRETHQPTRIGLHSENPQLEELQQKHAREILDIRQEMLDMQHQLEQKWKAKWQIQQDTLLAMQEKLEQLLSATRKSPVESSSVALQWENVENQQEPAVDVQLASTAELLDESSPAIQDSAEVMSGESEVLGPKEDFLSVEAPVVDQEEDRNTLHGERPTSKKAEELAEPPVLTASPQEEELQPAEEEKQQPVDDVEPTEKTSGEIEEAARESSPGRSSSASGASPSKKQNKKKKRKGKHG